MDSNKLLIKTLFISDVHLGTPQSSAKELLKVFKMYEMQEIIINGDFLDLTALSKNFYWDHSHTKVIQWLLKKSKKIKITYLIGNHDCYLREFLENDNAKFGPIELTNNLTYVTTKGEIIWIMHGDSLDALIKLNPWIYNIGDFMYSLMIKLNLIVSKIRTLLGLPYWSLSSYLKTKVKNVVSFLEEYENKIIKLLDERSADSIMIGHLHIPSIKKIGKYNYYNIGDFTETRSYIIEDLEGNISLKFFDKV